MIDLRSCAAAVAVVALAFGSPLPASAAYCGSNADTSAIEALVLARGPSDPTRVMDIIVVGNYARVDVQTKGRLTEYFVKDCGQWQFSGNSMPSEAPSDVASHLNAFVPKDNGGTTCQNPHFVNHPSGP